MSEYDDLLDEVLAGESGETPEPQTTEAISAPAKKTRKRKSAGASSKPSPVAEEAPAESKQAISAATPMQETPVEPARRGMSRLLERTGRCPMYAPRGTQCKVCGKVHPV